MKTILSFVGVLSMAAFATGCAAGGEESEVDSVGTSEQAITLDGAASASVAKAKEVAAESKLAGTLASCSMPTTGATYNRTISVPANSTIECTTANRTTLDTVLVMVQNANSAEGTPTNPCTVSPKTAEVAYRVLAFNDDANGVQSTISWTNNDGIARTVRLFGYLFSSSGGGSINVGCRINGGAYTERSGTFNSGSCRAYAPNPTSTTITATGGDASLFAMPENFSNQNHKFNDDCSSPNSSSCVKNMTTGTKTWFVDLCGRGASTASPQTRTVTF